MHTGTLVGKRVHIRRGNLGGKGAYSNYASILLEEERKRARERERKKRPKTERESERSRDRESKRSRERGEERKKEREMWEIVWASE